MPNKKVLIYALIAFILSFAMTFIFIKNYKKNNNQETIEKVQVK